MSDHDEKLLVVGISGHTGSGKTTVAQAFGQLGYTVLSTRAVVEELLAERGEPVTRAALQRLGGEIHRNLGQRWLLDRVVAGIHEGSHVIDGLRFPDDDAYLRRQYEPWFRHLHVTAPESLRRRRFISRGGTREEFAEAESDITESKVDEMLSLADWAMANEGSSDSLVAHVIQADNRWKGNSTCQ